MNGYIYLGKKRDDIDFTGALLCPQGAQLVGFLIGINCGPLVSVSKQFIINVIHLVHSGYLQIVLWFIAGVLSQ